MVIVVTIIHGIMCIILIAIVLLQSGKGASVGAAFGGASHTLFGAAGPASFLNKLTTIAAIVFMITSFTLAVISNRETTSSKVLEATPIQQEQPGQQDVTPPVSEEQSAPATTEEISPSEEVPPAENSQPAEQTPVSTE